MMNVIIDVRRKEREKTTKLHLFMSVIKTSIQIRELGVSILDVLGQSSPYK
jgi:hypothetical protein